MVVNDGKQNGLRRKMCLIDPKFSSKIFEFPVNHEIYSKIFKINENREFSTKIFKILKNYEILVWGSILKNNFYLCLICKRKISAVLGHFRRFPTF